MNDIIEYIGDSLVQHGKYNDRIYLMKLSRNDISGIIKQLDKIALDKGYSKVSVKVPEYAKESFLHNGYVEEAFIPRFYNAYENGYFLGKFFSEKRGAGDKTGRINEVLEAARLKGTKGRPIELESGFNYKIIEPSEASQLVEVYKTVFETYPFPIHDSEYILTTMKRNVTYFGIWEDNRIAAVSSAETDIESQNAEMTDFAVLPQYRGKNFAGYLLKMMEEEIIRKNMKVTYTIARATSFGMNITFAKEGYRFGGTLINNTNICGCFESMNVWYKYIQ